MIQRLVCCLSCALGISSLFFLLLHLSYGKIPSVLGWGANCARNPQSYIGGHIYVKPRQPDMMGAKLQILIVDILKRFFEATKVIPRHLMVFFSGISEGQFSLVTDNYMRAINAGIASMSANYKPNVTALVVSKDHNERLYKKNITGNRAAEQNIPPGTVVDTKIVSPVINEFYLNAHTTIQGTAKVPKYSLVGDTSKDSLDTIERITHALCFLHQIVAATISDPVPLVVADRCAKRGHDIFKANLSLGAAAITNIDEANEKLVYRADLCKVRYCA